MNNEAICKLARKLQVVLKHDVHPKRGATIRLLDSFLKAALGGGSNAYYGTFPADAIPEHLLGTQRFQIIVNTSRTTDPPGSGGHFIEIEASPERIIYIDPFGKPCQQPDIAKFIQDCQRPETYFNSSAVQDVSSVFCPLYCALFVLYHHLKPHWKLDFSRADLRANDKKCMHYINRLIRDPRLTPSTLRL